MQETSLSTISSLLVTEYGFKNDELVISKIEAGAENVNYRVVTPTEKYIFRLYNLQHSIRGLRDKHSIQLELEFMDKARANDMKVPEVIVNSSGKRFGAVDIAGESRFIALFKFIDGQMQDVFDAKNSAAVGQIVSQIFEVGESLNVDNGLGDTDIISRTFNKYDAMLTHTSLDNHVLVSEISDLNGCLRREVSSVKAKGFRCGLVHGDLKLENLLFDNAGSIMAVLDFDDYRYSYLIEEAVTALMHNLHTVESNIIRSGNYAHFLARVSNSDLRTELKWLRFFLRLRFLYDISAYLLSGLDDLVSQLWDDKHIQQHILADRVD